MRACRSPPLIAAVPRPSSAPYAEASVVCCFCLAGATAYAAPQKLTIICRSFLSVCKVQEIPAKSIPKRGTANKPIW